MSINNLDKDFDELLLLIKNYNPKANIKLIIKAWDFAKMAHTDQKRLTGESYVDHPLNVAKKLAEWKLDETSIIAGLLHDSVEDGGALREDIVSNFGEEVAVLVMGVTKITNLRLKGSKEEEFIENLRRMLLVMAKDLRVILVKLADRLHNLKSLYALTAEKQKENADETLEIYAPLAERLGMGRVKGELEDLSFPYAYPKEYKRLIKQSFPFYEKAEKHINQMKNQIRKKLLEEGLEAEVHGRKKHYYSLWKKLERPEIDWDFGKVNDIVALRMLVNTISQSYTCLGIIHSLYKPVPHIGVSDFIAQPKPNGYRSIHTKVFGPGGRIVEVQIRTHQMHDQAENGIAAHWAYSEVKNESGSDSILEKGRIFASNEKLSWVKQLVDWQKQITNSKEFLEAVKFDALKHRNFIFSPNGDVYDLPTGATPVDFAYAVHTDLGKLIVSAKVNGKLVSLDYKLQSGEVVEITKSKNPKKPNSDWLKFVVTTGARREINRYLRKEGN